MSSGERLALWIASGLFIGAFIGWIAGTISYNSEYESRRETCDEKCLQQVETFSRDCLRPDPGKGCPGPVGPSGKPGVFLSR